MGLVESAQMAQDYVQHRQDMEWNRRNFRLDKTALNIELVNTIREDLRDLLGQRSSRIDNLMVVNTLLFSFSFGFICEGTFAPEDSPPEWLTFYSLLMALTVVFPFWSIWASMSCKQTLDDFLNVVLRDDLEKRMDLESWCSYYDRFDDYWNEKCLLQYMIAQNFFWLGMMFCMTLASVLILLEFFGLYDDATVSYTFAGIVMANVAVAASIKVMRLTKWIYSARKQKKKRKAQNSAFMKIAKNKSYAADDEDDNIGGRREDYQPRERTSMDSTNWAGVDESAAGGH